MAIPRIIWNLIMAVSILGAAWSGRHVLEEILNNFLILLGYWTVSFGLILAIEHYGFRPRLGGYNFDGWQDPRQLPLGVAGLGTLTIAFRCSFIGMNQVWYTRPCAKIIGQHSGYVGDYFVLVTTGAFYPALRSLEIRYTGRWVAAATLH
ncbi:hypothetical protein BDW74DRAFT_184203 [Aspergillus multicolor]|uniref:uncharacterized protein n=1 Tax=Aspergillus multicolor TaxID=41759 RepID=UPI003CCDC198